MKFRLILTIILVFLFSFSLPLMAQEKIKKLILAGPKSSVTHPMTYMIEAGLLDHVAEEVELVIWDNPDQLRSLIAGNQAHFTALPSYVAAMFANKGVPVRLLNISTWGILYIVSSDGEIKTISDLKGEEISMPFRNDMPDLVFKVLARKQGLDPATDFTLKYRTNLPAVVQDILSGKVKHGLLAEPLVSVALMRSSMMEGKAPKLYRAVSLQEEWGKVYNRKAQIPQAGIAATPMITGNPEVVEAFQMAYEEAIAWSKSNPEEAGKIVEKHISGLKAKPVAISIRNAGLKFVSAEDAREEIEHFYTVLKSLNPAKIGGRLPDDDFYWHDKNKD